MVTQRKPCTPASSSNPLPQLPIKSITTAVSLELCCGSANLSSALHSLGLDALGIDYIRNPSKPKSAVLSADLSDPAGQQLVIDIVERADVEYCHAGPPCGTASRAREKKISSVLLRRGAPAPRQLRSASHPEGLPGLSPNELMRVQLANSIYLFVATLLVRLHLQNKLWTLENPLTSYFWLFPAVVALLAMPNVFLVVFQQCAHGGERPVWRQWATNIKGLQVLNAICDGLHPHSPFNISESLTGKWTFDTAQEAAYPTLLCRRVAVIVVDGILAKGYLPLPSSLQEADAHPETKRQRKRAGVGLFVRGNKLPQQLSEFGDTITLTLTGSHPPGSNVSLENPPRFGKVLRQFTGVGSESTNLGGNNYAVGIYRRPAQFLSEAVKLRHPIDLGSSIPDVLKQNVFWTLTNTSHCISRFRLEQLKKLRSLVATTTAQDKDLFESMSGQMQLVLAGKRLTALKIVLQQANYPDIEIINDIVKGIALTGPTSASGIYPRKLRPATITPTQLREGSKWTRRGILHKVNTSGDNEVDRCLWNEALEETSKGWLSGPFSQHQLEEKFDGKFVVSRRFGIRQGPTKIRAIDDFSESSVNASISTYEKIELMGVDDFVAILKFMAESVGNDSRVTCSLSDGTKLVGHLPVNVKPEQAKAWWGKTFDLKSAYRQLALEPEEQWASVIAVYCPDERETKLFIQHALPFGAVGSVVAFNRASRAVWAAATYWLRVTMTCFYDDFPTAEPQASSVACDLAVKAFFAIIGWTLSLEEKKSKSFSDCFDMLGVRMKLDKLPCDVLQVDNKPDRVEAVTELLDFVLSLRRCPAPIIAELKGKCQYAANQIFGRVAIGPLRLMSIQQFRCHSGILGSGFMNALRDFRLILNAGVPRTLEFKGEQRPLLVFTDGACEGQDRSEVSVGAVCYDCVDRSSFMFGLSLPVDLVAFWKSTGNVQTVGQAELLPVLLARIALGNEVRHRRIMYYIDNDSARHGLIKGHSDSEASDLIIRQLVVLESESQSWAWYSRVPSSSNPSDGPSRLRLIPHEENLFSRPIPAPAIPRRCWPDSSSSP